MEEVRKEGSSGRCLLLLLLMMMPGLAAPVWMEWGGKATGTFRLSNCMYSWWCTKKPGVVLLVIAITVHDQSLAKLLACGERSLGIIILLLLLPSQPHHTHTLPLHLHNHRRGPSPVNHHHGVAVPAPHLLLEPGCLPSRPTSPRRQCPWEPHGRVGWGLSTTAPAAAAFTIAIAHAPAATASVGGHGGLQWERAGGEFVCGWGGADARMVWGRKRLEATRDTAC